MVHSKNSHSPYSGQLWARSDGWHEGPTGFAITLGLALLNFLYVGLAILGIVHWRASPGIALIVATVVIRTAFLTQIQTCEPRYVLVCFPALLALAAQCWRGRWKLASTLEGAVPVARLSTTPLERVQQELQ